MLRRAVYAPPPPPPEVPPPDGRPRLALLTPCLMRGGAERWMLDLLQATREAVQWIGLAVLNAGNRHAEQVARVEATCLVWAGETGARELAAQAEALVVWGIPEWWRLVPERIWPHTAVVCQGTGEWSAATMAGCERGRPVAVSRDALRAIPEEQRSRSAIIHNGVSAERLRPQQTREELRRAWGPPQGASVLGFLGRLSGEKRPIALVEALAHLPGWRGVACGAGPELIPMLRRAEALGVGGRLRILGHTEDAGGFLRAIDVLLVPSYEEGYCYSGVEAWLVGTPTVWTPTGMAWERPDLVRGIPLDATGEEIAAAVLAPDEGRAAAAHEHARAEQTLERFGAAWTEFLLSG